MTDWLGPDLSAEVTWQATDAPLPNSPIADLFKQQWDIHKIAHYLPIYEKTFSPYRDRPIRMLEIGVSLGGSLELWRKYFRPNATIVGIDYNPSCVQFDNPADNIHVRIGAQQDTEFLQSVINEFGPFDIILDDGSHIPSLTLKSFRYLFPNGLADGGVYLVEDLFTCYSQDCQEPFREADANDGSPQFIEFVKYLIDVMHCVYLQTPTGKDIVDNFEPGFPDYPGEFTVPLAAKLISGIEIYDSIVVIRREPRELMRVVRRWSRERLASIAGPVDGFFANHPFLDEADRTRQDWAT